ncbi:MAG: hypothetical protein OMOMHJEC_00668 [Xanthomonadales bacterium]|nr:hypothetical protein [Xanthomonadales bacterium]
MQARARLHILIGTAGLMLAVPSFSPAEDYSRDSGARHGVLRGPLRVAAAQRLAPDFAWVDLDSLIEVPSLNPIARALGELLVVPLASERDWALYARAARLAERRPSRWSTSDDPTVRAFGDPGLERRLLTSGLLLETQAGFGIGVDAVFAEQRFASGSLTPLVDAPDSRLASAVASQEESRGTGLALAFGAPLTDRIGWSLGLRSRVDMNEYKSYRGVYSEPGDLDIPATAALGITAQIAPRTSVVLGAEQVFYSDINSFSSYALPNRFLALLGDSNSPSFAWQDLTVYSAMLQGGVRQWQWSLRYTTSLQPNPTAPLLQQAIEGIQSDSNWSLGVGRSLGGFGDVRLTASYAGAEYVLGSPLVRTSVDPTESEHFEFEALWNLRF